MAQQLRFDRDGLGLSCTDFGGDGAPVLLLHGLAGYSGEWAGTAAWLTKTHRVLALDARGHGDSERRPADVSPSALVADVAFVIEQVGGRPVALVGQSLGGVTALMTAARHPELVSALVLVEAGPSDGGNGEEAATSIGGALRSWPASFPSREAGEAFFRERWGNDLAAAAWADGLERTTGGWRPRFDVEVLVEMLREMSEPPTWEDWQAVICPTLILRAGHGGLQAEHAQQMLERLPAAKLVELPDAGHDLHLDSPKQWREALTEFLA